MFNCYCGHCSDGDTKSGDILDAIADHVIFSTSGPENPAGPCVLLHHVAPLKMMRSTG